jgi:hypothetical protein
LVRTINIGSGGPIRFAIIGECRFQNFVSLNAKPVECLNGIKRRLAVPPDGMCQQLESAALSYGLMIKRLAMMPGTPAVRAIAHVGEKPGLIGMLTPSDGSLATQQARRRAMEADGFNRRLNNFFQRLTLR